MITFFAISRRYGLVNFMNAAGNDCTVRPKHFYNVLSSQVSHGSRQAQPHMEPQGETSDWAMPSPLL